MYNEKGFTEILDYTESRRQASRKRFAEYAITLTAASILAFIAGFALAGGL